MKYIRLSKLYIFLVTDMLTRKHIQHERKAMNIRKIFSASICFLLLLPFFAMTSGNTFAFSNGDVKKLKAIASPTPNIPTFPVGGNSTAGVPGMSAFSGSLYIVWTGTDSSHHLNVIQSSDGTSFKNQVELTDTTQPYTPDAMAVFKSQLYVAWLSSGSDLHIYLGYYKGSSKLSNHVPIPNSCSITGPAMVSLNNVLYVAWIDCNNGHIDIASSGDGYNFSIETTDQSSGYTPALAVLYGQLYVSWTGNNTPSSVNIGTYPGYGTHITTTQLTDTTIGSMAAASYNGSINLSWRGYNNANLYTGYYIGSKQLANSHSLYIPAYYGSALANAFNHLYISWCSFSSNPPGQLDIAQIA